jgi:hypothetical protein
MTNGELTTPLIFNANKNQMTDRLGFTFYPKDWWTSKTFFKLPPEMRYVYLEIINLLYINDGYWEANRIELYKRFGVEVGESGWEILEREFDVEGAFWTHHSVNKRLKKAIASRENGKMGGRPKDEDKPKEPRKITYKNPPSEKKEKEKGKEIEVKYPTQQEVINFFNENDYSKEVALNAFKYYDDTRIDNGWDHWKDSKGTIVKSWKQKMRGVWFKPENKNKGKNDKKYEAEFKKIDPSKTFDFNPNWKPNK